MLEFGNRLVEKGLAASTINAATKAKLR